ncbi:MAG: ABC transporter permease [Candidatus Hodarchaeota archaeon]
MKLINFRLITYYFRENKHAIIANTLGLMFIGMIITITSISDLGFKMSYVEKEVSEKGSFNFSVIYWSESDYFSLKNKVNKIVQGISSTANQTNLEEMISNTRFYSISKNVDLIHPQTGEFYWLRPALQSVNRTLLEEMTKSSRFVGRLPLLPNEIIYLAAPNQRYNLVDDMKEAIVVGEEINISIRGYETSDNILSNKTLTIVGIYSPSLVSDSYSEERILDPFIIKHPHLHGHGLLTDHTLFNNLTTPLLGEKVSYATSVEFKLLITEKATFFTIKKILSDVKRFSISLSISQYDLRRFLPSNQYYISTNSLELVEFDFLLSELERITLMGFAAITPSIIITIFLSQYSSNMFNRSWEQKLGILRLRGITTNQVLVLILLEGIVSLIIAISIGYIIGTGISALILVSMSLFSMKTFIEQIIFSVNTFQFTFLWTALITGYFILKRELYASKLDVRPESTRAITPQTHQTSVKLGTLVFLAGVFGYVLFYILRRSPSSIPGSDELMTQNLGFLITLLLIPFPIFLLVGGILLMSYLIIPVLSKIAQKSWHYFGNLLSYSLTNMVRQRKAIVRVILIISILFSMFWLMLTAPTVMHTNIVRNSYYSIGADCYYSHAWNSTLKDIFQADPNIEKFSPIGTFRFDVSEDYYFTVFIISQNFLEVAYFEEGFSAMTSIESLINNSLNTTLYPILMHIEGLEQFGLVIGDKISLAEVDGTPVYFTIVDTYKYWPRLVINTYSQAEFTFVMTKVTFNQLLNTSVFVPPPLINEGFYFKLSSKANITQMKKMYGTDSLSFAQELINKTESSGMMQILRVHLTVLFLLNCFTIIVIIILYGYYQVNERGRELAVERALGMKIGQLTRSFLYESVNILFFSFIFGTIFGMIFSTFFVSIWLLTLSPSSIPPPVVFYPIVEINIYIGAFLVLGLVASIIPARFACKKNLTVELRTF